MARHRAGCQSGTLVRLVWCLVTSVLLWGQPVDAAVFSGQYRGLDQMPLGAVNAVYQDSRGFLWLGTDSGLCRYDGMQYQTFHHDPFDPNSLDHPKVLTIAEDSFGFIWVGSASGLNRLDPKTGFVMRFQGQDGGVNAMVRDQRGWLWLGTNRGLARLRPQADYDDFPDSRFESVPGQTEPKVIHSLFLDQTSTLWMGTDQGLFLFHADSGRRERVWPKPPAQPTAVQVILQDPAGFLWLGTERGLTRFAPSSGAVSHFRAEQGGVAGLPHNQVTALAIDAWDNLWVGLAQRGVRIFKRQSEQFIDPVAGDPWGRTFQGERSVQVLYCDRTGVMWIGTSAGLGKFTGQRKPFQRLPIHQHLNRGTLVGGIHALLVDWGDTIWLGTDAGLVNYRRSLQKSQLVRPTDFNLASNRVLALAQSQAGNILVGTDQGVALFDKLTQQLVAIPPPKCCEQGVRVTVVAFDSQGRMWVGTEDHGLWRVQTMGGQYRWHALYDTAHNFHSSHVTALLLDSSDYLWAGTRRLGLWRFPVDWPADEADQRAVAIGRWYAATDTTQSLNHISALWEGAEDSMWVGTAAAGLYRVAADGDKLARLPTGNPLRSVGIDALLGDERHRLWVVTVRGLYRFEPGVGRLRHYDRQPMSHGWGGICAAFRSERGELFFADKQSVTHFFPNRIRDNPYPPPVAVTDAYLRVGGQQQPMDLAAGQPLSYAADSVHFQFAALDFTEPSRNRYRYRLQGLSDHWTDLGASGQLSLYNLPPGQFQLQVQAANNDGVWNQDGLQLPLVVPAPPWKRGWAYLIYALIGVALGAGLVFRQSRQLSRVRRVSDQLKSANAQLRTSDRLKTEFLANTSHELRTPLNGMIGIADSMIAGAAGSLSKSQVNNLSMIVASGMRLSSLVNDLLDFAKMRHGGLELSCHDVDLRELVKLVLRLNKPLLRGKNVMLINEVPAGLPLVYADRARLEQIFHNLVGNAIKFTRSGSITIAAIPQERDVIIEVRDTGAGIPDDKLERIFESFAQVDGSAARSYGGTGLGLAITKQLVALHGGRLTVDTQLGVGSVFRFNLPIHHLRTEPQTESRRSSGIHAELLRLSEGLKPELRQIRRAVGACHILIVDDEPVNLQVLSNLLSIQNFAITHATSGRETLDLVFGEAQFDLILLDVMMPEMSGYEVCRAIREKYPPHELPIIMLTAKQHVHEVVTGFESGANDYLFKPVSKSELFARLDTHLSLLKTSRRLKISKEKLEDINRTLEEKVADRTRQLASRNKELELLDQVVGAINEQVELGSVLSVLLREALVLFPRAEKGLFLVLDQQDGAYHVAASHGYDEAIVSSLSVACADVQHWFKESASDPGVATLDDDRGEGLFFGQLPRPAAAAMTTLHLEGRDEGFLILTHASHRRLFKTSDLQKLQRLKAHAVSALTKARILDRVQRKHEALRRAQKQLKLQEKMAYLGSLTAGIAHEIRNPLNFVNNFAAVAEEMTGELTERLRDPRVTMAPEVQDQIWALLTDLAENAKLVLQHGERASRIVRGMMMHSTEGDRELRWLDANQVLKDQYHLVASAMLATGDGIEAQVTWQLAPSCCLDAVPQDLSRIVQNLFSNALFSLAERARAEARDYQPQLRVTTGSVGEFVVIRIWDNGVGIAPEHRDQIFTPFFTTKFDEAGIGLGLSICYDLVVQGHGGQLEFESRQGDFTEFVVRLPKHRSETIEPA